MEIDQKIKLIEEEIRKTPYHKGTEHHIGRLKAKIARLKDDQLAKSLKTGGPKGKGFSLKKSGDATVVLVGPPSVGKSTLINQITKAQSKVAAYDFTTVEVIPGMMEYQGAKIQIFDVPGIITGAAKGKGRGRQVLSVVRSADLIVIVVDVNSLPKIQEIKNELYEFGIRLDEEKPKINIVKTLKGGIKISSACPQSHLSLNTIKQIAQEFKIRNAEIVLKEDINLQRLIDAFMGNRVYLPYLRVVNKIDLSPKIKVEGDFIFISAKKGIGLLKLKQAIWEKLNLIRVYLQPKDKKADFTHPLIIKKGQNLREILKTTSLFGKESIKAAKIFGPGAKFPGQEVSLDFQPQEGTIISFRGG